MWIGELVGLRLILDGLRAVGTLREAVCKPVLNAYVVGKVGTSVVVLDRYSHRRLLRLCAYAVRVGGG